MRIAPKCNSSRALLQIKCLPNACLLSNHQSEYLASANQVPYPTTPAVDMISLGVNLPSGDVFNLHVTYNCIVPRQFFCWWFPESPYSLGLVMRGSIATNDE